MSDLKRECNVCKKLIDNDSKYCKYCGSDCELKKSIFSSWINNDIDILHGDDGIV